MRPAEGAAEGYPELRVAVRELIRMEALGHRPRPQERRKDQSRPAAALGTASVVDEKFGTLRPLPRRRTQLPSSTKRRTA